MALDDLLRAIEAEADEERDRAEREKAASAAAIVDTARQQAADLEAQLIKAADAESRAAAERLRAVARLRAADTVRAAREEAYVSLLGRVGEELCALRGSAPYRRVFAALLNESRAALPEAHELRVDRRDQELADSLAGDLRVVAVLNTWGGLDLAGEDGRTVRNTLEERLANADPLLRGRFAQWLDSHLGAALADAP